MVAKWSVFLLVRFALSFGQRRALRGTITVRIGAEINSALTWIMDVAGLAMAFLIIGFVCAMPLSGKTPWMTRKTLDAQRSI